MFEIRPEREAWDLTLNENIDRIAGYSDDFLLIRKSIRTALYEAATKYQAELRTCVADRKLSISLPEITYREHAIGTGHQATLFHQGIARKYQETARAAKELMLSGFHVILDLDSQHGGDISYPEYVEDRWMTRSGSIGSQDASFAIGQTLQFCSQPFEALQAIEMSDEQHERIEQARVLYRDLDGLPMVHAHTLVRYALFGEDVLLEVPLSYILQNESVQKLFSDWAAEGASLVSLYNKTLDTFRLERKIKNSANPFPNLQCDELSELPLWSFDLQKLERSAVTGFSESSPFVYQLSEDDILVPRGALISLFFRTFCFDFFVHGLGGERYDRFTDMLIEKWLDVTPLHYGVVSETRYLFAEATKIQDVQTRVEKLRDYYGHVEELFALNVISDDVHKQLQENADTRTQLVNRIKEANEKEERSALSQELKSINQSIRDLIDEAVGHRWKSELQQLEKSKATFLYRAFPFFCFS